MRTRARKLREEMKREELLEAGDPHWKQRVPDNHRCPGRQVKVGVLRKLPVLTELPSVTAMMHGTF